MTKKYARFLSALFCGFLAVVFAANALTPDRESSEMENRALAQRPRLTARAVSSGTYMADYETYATDQFAGRDGWVAAKAYAERALGKQENNGVYFCADSTLISRFDEPDGAKVEKNAGYVAKFAEKAGAPVAFGLIPTQAYVWADKLPQGAPNYDQRQVYADVTSALAGKAALADGLWDALWAHRDEPIFYRTDHHWTSLGAYYGYAALGEVLGYEPLPLDAYEKTTVSTEFYGTVFSTSGARWVKPDEIDVYVPEEGIAVTSCEFGAAGELTEVPRQLYDESYLAKKDKYAMFLGGQQALCKVETGRAGPKLLLIRDSYSDSLVPFLTAHFSEIHLIDLRYYKLSAARYVRDNGIDQVLALYSAPNFVSDGSLVWLGK